jgi:hypothetical protein
MVNVLNLERISAENRAKIEAIDPAVDLTDPKGWFDGQHGGTITRNRGITPGGCRVRRAVRSSG